MIPDIDTVTTIIRETAAAEIMPRFRRLGDADISEKGPGDLVTIADLESEKRLTKALKGLAPGSLVVGEEAADADPAVLDALSGDDPVWLVDPVDGTANFAGGKACFAVVVAYVRTGETVVGWIHDPVNDVTAIAAAGDGAWIGQTRLQVAAPTPLGEMAGSLLFEPRKRLTARREAGDEHVPKRLVYYRCAGREYLDLARGILHFAQFGRRLKPWDHAAGVLMHREAGGFAALEDGQTPYGPASGIVHGMLLMAPDAAGWVELRAVVGVG